MEKNKVKLLVDIGMVISFLLVGITGILKMPALAYNVSRILDFRLMSRIHDWSGVILVVFILVHLCLNWPWIKSMILGTFIRKDKCEVKNER